MAAYLSKVSTARLWSAATTSASAMPLSKHAFTAARGYSTKLARNSSAISSIKSARGPAAFRTLSSSARVLDEKLATGTLQSPSELARKLSEAALPLLPRPDVKKVLVVGSGGLSIGQAGEFDYSGELRYTSRLHLFPLPRLEPFLSVFPCCTTVCHYKYLLNDEQKL
jgi:hypothetical protein